MGRFAIDYLGILLAAVLVVGYYAFNWALTVEAISVLEDNTTAFLLSLVSFFSLFMLGYTLLGSDKSLTGQPAEAERSDSKDKL